MWNTDTTFSNCKNYYSSIMINFLQVLRLEEGTGFVEQGCGCPKKSVVQAQNSKFNIIDLFQNNRKLTLSIGRLVPNLTFCN